MFKFYKPMMIISSLLWISFIFHIVLLEIIGLIIDKLLVTGVITIVLLIFIYAYFIYYYFKNKPRIKKLKEQYLDSLKPDKPLRFCPTDDELLRKYKEQEKTGQFEYRIDKEEIKEDTDEDEIEM